MRDAVKTASSGEDVLAQMNEMSAQVFLASSSDSPTTVTTTIAVDSSVGSGIGIGSGTLPGLVGY